MTDSFAGRLTLVFLAIFCLLIHDHCIAAEDILFTHHENDGSILYLTGDIINSIKDGLDYEDLPKLNAKKLHFGIGYAYSYLEGLTSAFICAGRLFVKVSDVKDDRRLIEQEGTFITPAFVSIPQSGSTDFMEVYSPKGKSLLEIVQFGGSRMPNLYPFFGVCRFRNSMRMSPTPAVIFGVYFDSTMTNKVGISDNDLNRLFSDEEKTNGSHWVKAYALVIDPYPDVHGIISDRKLLKALKKVNFVDLVSLTNQSIIYDGTFMLFTLTEVKPIP